MALSTGMKDWEMQTVGGQLWAQAQLKGRRSLNRWKGPRPLNDLVEYDCINKAASIKILHEKEIKTLKYATVFESPVCV